MKICANCGMENEDTKLTCQECGEELVDISTDGFEIEYAGNSGTIDISEAFEEGEISPEQLAAAQVEHADEASENQEDEKAIIENQTEIPEPEEKPEPIETKTPTSESNNSEPKTTEIDLNANLQENTDNPNNSSSVLQNLHDQYSLAKEKEREEAVLERVKKRKEKAKRNKRSNPKRNYLAKLKLLGYIALLSFLLCIATISAYKIIYPTDNSITIYTKEEIKEKDKTITQSIEEIKVANSRMLTTLGEFNHSNEGVANVKSAAQDYFYSTNHLLNVIQQNEDKYNSQYIYAAYFYTNEVASITNDLLSYFRTNKDSYYKSYTEKLNNYNEENSSKALEEARKASLKKYKSNYPLN
ncbi:MAG: zinc ribbon domain-containing protein [Lachnospirales bacterium]